jgi:hypothetical protein
MGPEPWAPGQVERYAHALEAAWDDFEQAYYATLKRVGLQSIAAQHAGNYMRQARMLRQTVDGLLARPTRTDETANVVREAVKKLGEYKRQISYL